MMAQAYAVYILRCADGSYYTGITLDLDRRIQEHNHSPKGARYTRGRRPVTLAYFEACPDKREALRREIAIKKMSRKAKINLIRKGVA